MQASIIANNKAFQWELTEAGAKPLLGFAARLRGIAVQRKSAVESASTDFGGFFFAHLFYWTQIERGDMEKRLVCKYVVVSDRNRTFIISSRFELITKFDAL